MAIIPQKLITKIENNMKKIGSDLKLREYADKILDELKTEKYTDCDTDVPGILKEQNGEKKYTSYGDYFYMEALCKSRGTKVLNW